MENKRKPLTSEQRERARLISNKWYYDHKNNRSHKIYTLSDNNGNVFYVGSTEITLPQRKAIHINRAKMNRGNKDLCSRVNEIIDSGEDVTITQLACARDRKEMIEIEKICIKLFNEITDIKNKRCLK